MAESNPLLAGNNRHEILFDFYRVFLAGETEAEAEPRHMGIDHNARGNFKSGAQQDVGRFSSDARQFDQLFEGLRRQAFVVFDQQSAAILDALRLVAKEAGALDRFFQIGDRRLRIVFGRPIFAEEFLRNDIHALVGTLGGEDGRHEQFQGRVKIKRTSGIRVKTGEPAHDVGSMFLGVFQIELDFRGR